MTRHPNYFGNAAMWWGIFLLACSATEAKKSVHGPLVMTFLLTKARARVCGRVGR